MDKNKQKGKIPLHVDALEQMVQSSPKKSTIEKQNKKYKS